MCETWRLKTAVGVSGARFFTFYTEAISCGKGLNTGRIRSSVCKQ